LAEDCASLFGAAGSIAKRRYPGSGGFFARCMVWEILQQHLTLQRALFENSALITHVENANIWLNALGGKSHDDTDRI
jgi:hypothetical protein